MELCTGGFWLQGTSDMWHCTFFELFFYHDWDIKIKVTQTNC